MTSSESSIETFVLLAKNAKGKAAANLILESLKHPSTFLFGELLEMPNIKALAESDSKKEYETLKLFAFGTYKDYKSNPTQYAELNEKLVKKLKQLTIVSLASQERILLYKKLLSDLDVQNVRSLEDLLIDCMYQGLIRGKLDQKLQCFEVYDSVGRDLKEGELLQTISVLKKWLEHGEKVLKSLDQNQNNALGAFEANKKQRQEFDDKVEEIKKNIKASLDIQTDVDMDDVKKGGKKPNK